MKLGVVYVPTVLFTVLTLATLNDFGEKTLLFQPKNVPQGSLRPIPDLRG